MTMTVAAMPSSEASSPPPSNKRTTGGLLGPRPLPLPLKVSSSSRSSPPASNKPPSSTTKKPPVIVYEHTPKVIHARPQEFMTVVQRLTGKPPAAPSSSLPSGTFSPATAEEAGGGGDPLLLTLGQRQQAAAPAPATTTTLLPSPMAAGMLLSPGFIFSPSTMQAIQELNALF